MSALPAKPIARDAEAARSASAKGAVSDENHDQATALALWVALVRTFAVVAARAAADIARHDLTPGEFGVLETLYHKGPLLLVDLQRKQLVSSGGITYLVDRLEQRGLAERRPCRTDRRARYAALTPEGTALIARIFPEHAAVIQSALAGLDSAEQQSVAQSLKRLGEHSQATCTDPTPFVGTERSA